LDYHVYPLAYFFAVFAHGRNGDFLCGATAARGGVPLIRALRPAGRTGHTAERGLDADLVSANLLDRFEGVVDVIGGGLLRRLGVAATDGVSNG
jgi:hypothetical protein